MKLKVEIVNETGPALERLGRVFPGYGNFIANQISEEFAEFVRERYLSGQVLAVQTGETRESTRLFKDREGVFGVRPGVGVRGSLNYLLRFERGALPFMRPAYRSFTGTGAPQETANRIVGALIRKEGLA